MWYDDPEAKVAMRLIGLIEIESGRWATPDLLREIIDFGSGIIMTTRLSHDRPEFDVQTIHNGHDRGIEFLNDAIDIHLKELAQRTQRILKDGIEHIKPVDKPS
jgi:hypothetical protein